MARTATLALPPTLPLPVLKPALLPSLPLLPAAVLLLLGVTPRDRLPGERAAIDREGR